MKKFTFKGVLDGFRSSTVNQSSPLGQSRICTEQEIQETLKSEHFQLRKVIYRMFKGVVFHYWLSVFLCKIWLFFFNVLLFLKQLTTTKKLQIYLLAKKRCFCFYLSWLLTYGMQNKNNRSFKTYFTKFLLQ